MSGHIAEAGTPREDVSRGLRVPVIEMFGPTIQGEGPDAGRRCHFIRLGYCDYRCSWCDSMHAVDPVRVREHPRLTHDKIAQRIGHAPAPGALVILSGGNPVVHDLAPLVALLRGLGWRVAVETQGSIWRDWLVLVHRLTVSPKPPSSGMHTTGRLRKFRAFMRDADPVLELCGGVLKVVVGSVPDLEWARILHNEYPRWPLYLSALTNHEPRVQIDEEGAEYDHPPQTAELRQRVALSYRWLCEAVLEHPDLHDVSVLPQLHVVAWGAELGR